MSSAETKANGRMPLVYPTSSKFWDTVQSVIYNGVQTTMDVATLIIQSVTYSFSDDDGRWSYSGNPNRLDEDLYTVVTLSAPYNMFELFYQDVMGDNPSSNATFDDFLAYIEGFELPAWENFASYFHSSSIGFNLQMQRCFQYYDDTELETGVATILIPGKCGEDEGGAFQYDALTYGGTFIDWVDWLCSQLSDAGEWTVSCNGTDYHYDSFLEIPMRYFIFEDSSMSSVITELSIVLNGSGSQHEGTFGFTFNCYDV